MKNYKIITYLILFVFILINISLRYPSTPHEIGWDSFFMHDLSNSISTYGYPKWWIDVLSPIGYYPLSYSSGLPLVLSGFAQISTIPMEDSIQLFCFLEGILIFISSFLMAGEMSKSLLFRFSVSMALSISSGILWFTTWTASSRGILILFLILFVFLLLRYRSSGNDKRYVILAILILITSMTLHKLFLFAFIIIICYWLSNAIYELLKDNTISKYKVIPFIIIFIIMFILPFLSIMGDVSSYYVRTDLNWESFADLILYYAGTIGISIFIGVIGIAVLLFKRNYNKPELMLLLVLLLMAPFVSILVYVPLFLLIFFAVFFGYGIVKINQQLQHINKLKKISIIVLITFCVITWGGVVQIWHPGTFETEKSTQTRHMSEENYNNAIWIREYVEITQMYFSNDNVIADRTTAISQRSHVASSGPQELIYDYTNASEMSVITNPLYQWALVGPYKRVEPKSLRTYAHSLSRSEFTSEYVNETLKKLNIAYVIENVDNKEYIFFSQVGTYCYKTYSLDNIDIWMINIR